VLDASVLDDRYLVSNGDAVIAVRRLLREEGIFAGLSSGAVLHVALRAAEELEEGTIVILLADGGWKYLSTGIYDRPLEDLDQPLEQSLLW
jgi:cysteine synthase